MKQDATLPAFVVRWQTATFTTKVRFVLLFTRLAWKYASLRQRAELVTWYANLLLPGALVMTLIFASWQNNPVALIASICALAVCRLR
jgi:hypothetical protein